MAPMADRIMADFNIGATAFGSLGAVYFYIYAAMQLPAGTLADTLGPRKTITIGLLLSATGSIVMSQAPSFGMLYAGRVLVSFGVSTVWLNVIKLLMVWFRTRELGTMTGLSSAVVNSGQIAAATPLALLIISIGWQMSLLTIAVVTFGIAAFSWFIIKDSPLQTGLPPIAELDEQDPQQVTESLNLSVPNLAQRFKSVLGNRHLWPLFLVHMGIYGTYSTFFHSWAVIYLMQNYGLARDSAANFVLMAAIGQIVGAPLVGLLSDRILQKRRLPVLVLASTFLALFLLMTLWNGGKPPLEALYPMCFFIGLSVAGVPLIFAAVKDVARPSVQGMATGLVNMGGFISAAIAQPLFGYLLDRGWQGDMIEGARLYPLAAFRQGLLLCCALAASGFIGTLLTKETGRSQRFPVL